MTLRTWSTDDARFREKFSGLMAALSLEGDPSVQTVVDEIIADVRARGDAALLDYTERFDGCRLTPGTLRVSQQEIDEAVERCPAELLDALRTAAERVRTFQQATLVPTPDAVTLGGRTMRVRYTPVDSAAIYVAGASASLASSVLMTAVPARVAGVPRVVMSTPPRPDGTVSDDRLAAAHIAGVDEVYRLGGAPAMAALAWGTESVQPVDFVAGPSNMYWTLAKKVAFGQVGIDMLAGPSEVIIIADSSADAQCVAADLLAQAEHAPGSAVLLTDDAALASGVVAAVDEQIPTLSRGESARDCLARYGVAIVCRSIDECIELANEMAAEHLQIVTREADVVAERIRHAGAIFVGRWTPVAVGDYIAGPSHVLPTARTARFAGPLSANDFRKRSSVICYNREALVEDADAVQRMAEAEGLSAHAASVRRRLENDND
jgi:histidinol dehydrogenase